MVIKRLRRAGYAIGATLAFGLMFAGAAQAEPRFRKLYEFEKTGKFSIAFANGVTQGKDGALYGAISFRDLDDTGEIYRLAPPKKPNGAWRFEVVHDFASGGAGFPSNGVTLDSDGVIYGTVGQVGGQGVDAGGVYRLKPNGDSGSTFELLHRFDVTTGAADDVELTMGNKGELYGVSSSGGVDQCGVAFRLSPKADGALPWTYEVLADFRKASHGCRASTPLVRGKGGVLYGALEYDGRNRAGSVFALKPNKSGGYGLEILHAFRQGKGLQTPTGPIAIDKSGALVGAGYNDAVNNCGGVFRLSPPKKPEKPWDYKEIKTFKHKDGCGPSGVTVQNDEVLVASGYGVKPDDFGKLFSLKPKGKGDGYSTRIAHRFTSDAWALTAAPIVGADGKLYGVVGEGSAIFSLQR